MPKQTLTERVTVLETSCDILFKDIKTDISDIKTNIKNFNGSVNKISLEMPELLRKVNEHHTMYRDLKAANCPNVKVQPTNIERPKDGNGGYVERRAKKPLKDQWKQLPAYKKISTLIVVVPFFIVYGEWIFDKAHAFLTWLELILK